MAYTLEKLLGRTLMVGDCMEYQKVTTANNPTLYGSVMHNGKRWLAHRLSYTLKYGEIPKGLLACHKCDNPKCINPDHIFIGTHKDNAIDMARKGRSAFSANHGQSVTLTFTYTPKAQRNVLRLQEAHMRNTGKFISVKSIASKILETATI